jgi:hypothetical protein
MHLWNTGKLEICKNGKNNKEKENFLKAQYCINPSFHPGKI